MRCAICDAPLAPGAECEACGDDVVEGDYLVLARSGDETLRAVLPWNYPGRGGQAISAVLFLIVSALATLVGGSFTMRFSATGVVVVGVFGAAIAYLVAASLRNRTTVVLEDGVLSVSHGPLPWPGAQRVDTRTIEQLGVTAATYRGRVLDYRLHARLSNGQRCTLVHRLATEADAALLAEHLERALGFE